jgi:small GTP-binding protein
MNKNIKRKKFNISLLGESEVGKTRITNCYLGKEIEEINLSTIGIESYIDVAKFDGEEYKFKIYDTAGQERYRSISKSTIKITDGFILVFSVANKQSFTLIDYWFNSIKEEIDIKKKVIYLVGNKIDLENREVSNEEAVNYAKMKDILYFETSARTGFGVKEVFQQLYQDIYTLFKNNKANNNDSNDNIELNNKKDKKKGKMC